ncbi:unnamed protein product [Orchesella dallaii]|uniref:C2H2-type domain-containing protein n=1 Tax=Orchesella dallaii TaxID=48710 RepID=A0ABP1QE21_9HEXA
MTSRARPICLICLKRFGNIEEEHCYQPRVLSPSSGLVRISEKDELNQHQDLYIRFLYFVNRYLKLTAASERFITGAKERKLSGGEDGPVQAFCEKCQEMVSYVCDLYTELNAVKLHLLWKLGELGDVMVKGKKAVSDKLARGLVKSLMTQLNVISVRSILSIRKHILLKCKMKCKGNTPKVLVHKGLFPEHWYFTYSATKRSLMVLIVIFALASSAVYAKKRVEAEETDILTKSKGRGRSKKSVTFRDIKNNFDEQKCATIIKKERNGDDEENHVGSGDDDYGDNDDGPPDTFENNSDSDWSRGAASPTSVGSAGSDADFDPTSNADSDYRPSRRWNLRRTRKRVTKMGAATASDQESGEENEHKADKEFKEKKRRQKVPETDDRPRTLPCTKCNRTFVDTRGLSKHLQHIHGSTLDYSCPHCGLKFKKLHHMQSHKRKTHRFQRARRFGKAPIESRCSVCNEMFPTRNAMLLHKRQAHKIRWTKHECPVCFKTVVSEGRFQRHLLAHKQNAAKDVKVFYCEVCGKHFYKESSLSDHIVKVHDGCFPCSLCDAKYPSSKFLRAHLETHETPEKFFFCAFCFRGFTNQQYYDMHRKITHTDKRKMVCEKELCSEEFESIEELNEHLKIHVAEALAKKLGQQAQGSSAENHPQSNGNGSDAAVVADMIENVTANEIATVQGNTAVNETINAGEEHKGGITPPDTAGNSNDMVVEQSEPSEIIDDGTTIFKCSHCGWGFLKKYNLTLHELVHTPHSKEKTGYDCPQCGKNVRYLDTLIAHYNRVHGSGLKPYKCKECNSLFSSPVWYKTHMKLHEERKSGKKFICYVCNVECLDSVSLSSHKRGHTPGMKGHDRGVIGVFRRRPYFDEMDPSSPPPAGEKRKKRPGRPRSRPRTKEELDREKELAAKWQNAPCEVCSKKFESAYMLRKHLESIHENDTKSCHCYFCDLTFTMKQTRDLHVRAMHKEKRDKFDCDDDNCEASFTTTVELNEHLKSHLVEEPESEANKVTLDENTGSVIEAELPKAQRIINYCQFCEWGFLSKDLMELHQLIHVKKQNGAYHCPNCTNTFVFVSQLQSHFNSQHGSNLMPYKCFECNKRFFSQTTQRLHIKRHNMRREQIRKDPNTVFICIDCGATCMDAKALEKHRKRHDPANHLKCTEPGCDVKFEEKKQLIVHLKRVHNKGEEYPCPICGVTFIFQHYIKQHMNTHLERTHECKTCGKMFRRIHTLRKHELTHDANRTADYICAECGMAYKSESGLKFHVGSMHTPDDQKKFACPHCPKRYHRQMLLKMHLKACRRSNGISEGSEEVAENTKQSQSMLNRPARKQPTRQRKRPKRWLEEEKEEDETSSSEEEQYKANVSDPEEKPEVEENKSSMSSSMNSSAISAIISNFIGMPDSDVSDLTVPTSKKVSTKKRTNPGKNVAATSTSLTGGTSTFQTTIDQMLLQSMTQQQPHNGAPSSSIGNSTNPPNNQNQSQWLQNNTAYPSPFANPFHGYDMPNILRPSFNLLSSIHGSNVNPVNSHSSSPPVSQHQQYNAGEHDMSQEALQQQQQNMYSPNHVYSPPPDQPQNLHYGNKYK